MASQNLSNDTFLINVQTGDVNNSLYVFAHTVNYYNRNSDVGPNRPPKDARYIEDHPSYKPDEWYVANNSFEELKGFFEKNLFPLRRIIKRGSSKTFEKQKLDISYSITDHKKVRGLSMVVEHSLFFPDDAPRITSSNFVRNLIKNKYEPLERQS